MSASFPGRSFPGQLVGFLGWTLHQMFKVIPESLTASSFARPVSRTPIWLADGNPFANYPWSENPAALLPNEAEVVVIGAGFTGGGCAYHWSKQNGGQMIVLEMDDPASGASGRNEGLVVMGRYFAYVRNTVRPYLDRVRSDLSPNQRDRLAEQFAGRYVESAYKNADLIEQTVRDERIECDYARKGWIQGRDAEDQPALGESIKAGEKAGFHDWTSMSPDEVLEKGGMKVDHPAGFSRKSASFHPAKWVWGLFRTALAKSNVSLFARCKVRSVEDHGEHYLIHTERGDIKSRFIINATESYTAILHRQYRRLIHPVQTQAAFGEDGPEAVKPHIGLSGKQGFFGRHGSGVMVGSDATRVPYRSAGSNNPSRFITKFLIGDLLKYFGPSDFQVTHEWSGTPGFTVDEYPVVGLLDDKRQYIIGGMCGSGTAVSFNGARHVVQQILGLDGPDDYPSSYFSPTRILDPDNHNWPEIESLSASPKI